MVPSSDRALSFYWQFKGFWNEFCWVDWKRKTVDHRSQKKSIPRTLKKDTRLFTSYTYLFLSMMFYHFCPIPSFSFLFIFLSYSFLPHLLLIFICPVNVLIFLNYLSLASFWTSIYFALFVIINSHYYLFFFCVSIFMVFYSIPVFVLFYILKAGSK